VCVSKKPRKGKADDEGEDPLGLEAIPPTQKSPFVDFQPFVPLFPERTVALAPLTFLLEHTLATDFARADHIFDAVPSLCFITFPLIAPLCCSPFLCSFAGEDAVGLWR